MFHRLFLGLIGIYIVKTVSTLSTSTDDAHHLCQYKTTLDILGQKSDLSYQRSMLTQASLENLQQTVNILLENLSGLRSMIQTLHEDLRSSCTDHVCNVQEEGSQVTTDEKGVVLTRWGRPDCPLNTSTLVYSGFAGGSLHTDTGSAANYVCLPEDPTWGAFKDYQNSGKVGVGHMYGAEYQDPHAIFGVTNHKEKVPCSVCIGKGYSMLVMIPGRKDCYGGWTELYHGNLASNSHKFEAAGEYVCVDESPVVIPGRNGNNDNGKLFYGVKTVCGSLPCPPYEDGKFLSCVVCMK